MKKHVASWDMGLVLQLVYSGVLKENKDVKSMINLVYRVISDWKSGQTG